MSLGLALIVKNEQDNLRRCLSSVSGVFDKIVIVDTGSTDDTKKVALEFGAEIYDFEWIDDFSAARNFSFSKLDTDFLMWLDADDEILPADKANLLELKGRLGDADAYLMPYNYAQDEFGHCSVKLFRHRIIRRGVPTWNHPIHECMSFKSGCREAVVNIWVTHRRSGTDATKDFGRNIRILEKALTKTPDDVRIKYYYAKELFSEGRLEESIAAFEKYFATPGGWHDDQVNGHWYMAMALWQLGKEDEAINLCLKGIKLDPRFAEFYVIIGQVHYNKERWGQAIPWFELASHCKPPEAFGTVLTDNYTWVPADRLCKCYSSVGKLFEAYAANEKALSFRPEDFRLQYNKDFMRDLLFPGRRAEQPIRLSLGSGGKPTPGYRNTDLYPGNRIEEVFDQTEIPYQNACIHAIHSEHALEHADSHEAAEKTITEWARVLRHGGDLVLKIPDLEICCLQFLQSEDRDKLPGERFAPREWYKYTIYGIQKSQGSEPADGQFHRTGFTKAGIRRLLEANGFRVNSLNNYDGWGTPSIEIHATQVAQVPKICWLIPGTIDENHASLRLRCLNVSRWLSKHGVDSRLIEDFKNKPDLFEEIRFADVAVFISFGQFEEDLIAKLRRSGVSVIHDHCEDLKQFKLPYQVECFGAASLITCCSTVLAEKTKDNRVAVLPDAYEAWNGVHTYEPHGTNGKLRVVWCGYGGNAENAEPLRPIIESLGMELQIISEWDNADKKWNKDTWLDDLANADIIISPQRHWSQPAKSNNKVTQAMALGLPVLASPIKSYEEVIRHGENGFISKTPEEWERDLKICSDQAVRERVGKAAKESVSCYSIDFIGQMWKDLIAGLASENCNPPAVDIVIPTWNNLKLLQECIKSIKANTAWPHRIIVVNSGTDGTKEWLEQNPDITAINKSERQHFSAANNLGIAAGSSEYVCLLNDDTIVAKGWLGAMMQEAMKPGVGTVNPLSNCDLNWQHQEVVVVDNISLYPGMLFDNVEAVIPKIYEIRHKKVVTEREWVAFYGTIIPRKVIGKVGQLDEGFKSGCEDLDYCRRIKACGYRIVTTYDAFIFHFGGSTRKRADALNTKLHHDEDAENNKYFEAKYGSLSGPAPATLPAPPIKVIGAPTMIRSNGLKRFVLYTGAAWETWTPKSLNQGGIGGSETCAIYLAKEFQKRGWDSHVVSACGDAAFDCDGVHYHPWQDIQKVIDEKEIDLFVSSRRPEVFQLPMKAKRKICWVHDIWLNDNPNADIFAEKIDEFFCLSPWHRDFFCAHHKVPQNKVYITRDGIDLRRFDAKVPRERGRLIYTSSPDRGLDILLDAMPLIREKIPEANLHVFYGFKNWEAAVKVRNNKAEIDWMENIKKMLQQPGVTFHGRIGQDQLALEFLKSELWAYPTYFTETFCITAAEAMAAGLPVITTPLAALATTVGDAGIMLHGDPRSEMFQNQFVRECVEMLSNKSKWDVFSKKSIAKAAQYGWDTLVDDWLRHLGL